MTKDQPPGEPAREDDPTRPPPRPVPPPGQVSTPDQLPTVEPGEWPAQPPRAVSPPAPPDPPQEPVAPVAPAAPYVPAVPVRRGHGWVWLTLAAAVVLVVGVAATLVVVRPWRDDGRDTGPETVAAPRDVASDAGAGPEPSGVPTPTPAPSPAPVTGDLDGDGFGDAVAVFGAGDDVQRYVLSSSGRAFKVAREPLSSFEDRTWADFDRDGTIDEVSWSYELDGTLTITSPDLDFGATSVALRLERRQPFVSLKPGDFDGDGATDLLAYGATDRRTVTAWMLRNDGDGFAEPAVWMQIPDTTYALTTLLPADLTGDGRTDVAARVPSEPPRGRGSDRLGVAILASTGSAFVPGPLERPTRFLDDADAVVGDFTGDGEPRVLLIGSGGDGLEVQALRAHGSRLVRERRADRLLGGAADVVDAVVADVDGDRVDDVVFTASTGRGRAYDGFRVLRPGDTGQRPGEVWAPTPRCPSADCSFYFQNS